MMDFKLYICYAAHGLQIKYFCYKIFVNYVRLAGYISIYIERVWLSYINIILLLYIQYILL